ncbi:MAG: VWA domain-containing protein [Deltaproteobacteria bacterium]
MEHLTGRGIDKFIRFLHDRRLKKWGAEAAPFELKSHLRRFGMLASMIAGREVRAACIKGDAPPRPYLPVLNRMAHPGLLPDHGFGWSDGETVFLPISVVDMPDIRGQESLARLVLFFLSSQIRHGTLEAALSNRALLEGDRLVADIYWIIENTRLFQVIRRDFPGVLRDWERTVAHLRGRRPGPEHTNGAEWKVEEFLRRSLDDSPGGAAASSSPDESIIMAKAAKERWIKEGARLSRYGGMVPFTPWGKLIPGRIKEGPSSSGASSGRQDPDRTPAADTEGRENAPGVRNRYAAAKTDVKEEENEQGLTLNIYDKIMAWAEFVNVTRPFDDDPEENGSGKADEMEELTTAEVKRSARAFFDADLEKTGNHPAEVPEREVDTEKVFTYPEWDYRRQAYGADASRVSEFIAASEGLDAARAILNERKGAVKEVTRKFEALTPAARLKSRQLDGEFIDLDAAVEAISDLEAGKTPGDRLYATYTRSERDLSALFLVDLSMSTDAWVGDRRIIDHEKEALIILCEAMSKLRDRHAIYGFSGRTRKGCRFYHIKGFRESYGDRVKQRIGALIPYHYTRMGPAVRHATSILKKESSRVRLLFLLSDGKPNDVDAYEGRYGMEDTRMAVKEAEKEGIIPFCLTVDNNAQEYLPRLFGKGNHAVVSGADKLTKSLPELYARIIRRL